MTTGAVTTRKELLVAVKDFLNPHFSSGRLNHEEFKALAKEAVKISSIVYPTTKAELSSKFLDLILSHLGADHQSLPFFQEEKSKLVVISSTSADTHQKVGGGEADDMPTVTEVVSGGTVAGAFVPNKKAKRTLAGLRDHMKQAAADIETAKAQLAAEETSCVIQLNMSTGGVGTTGGVSILPIGGASSVLVALEQFPMVQGREQASAMSAEVFQAVTSVFGDSVESFAAPAVTSTSGTFVFPGVVVLQCKSEATANEAATKATTHSWGFAGAGTVQSSILLPPHGGLAATAMHWAKDRASKLNITAAPGSSAGNAADPDPDTDASRGKRGRDGW